MANVFLDTNVFIDLIEKRNINLAPQLKEAALFISSLSLHIWIYLYKYKMPYEDITNLKQYARQVPLTEEITSKALMGTTKDFEDNVQLHSAAISDCQIFYTNDKELLELKYFGNVEIQMP